MHLILNNEEEEEEKRRRRRRGEGVCVKPEIRCSSPRGSEQGPSPCCTV